MATDLSADTAPVADAAATGPRRRRRLVLAAVVLAVIAWQGFIAAADSFAFNDITADLGLPRVWHWSALLVGVVASVIAALAIAWSRNGEP